MHDDRPIVDARLARVLAERINPAVRSERVQLDVDAWSVPGEPVPVAEALAADYEPFARGAAWGRPWGTTWFRVRGVVPEHWSGRRVEARIDLGFGSSTGFQGEGLVWGPAPPEESGESGETSRWVPLRGLHPRNHDVLVADPAIGGERFELLVEAAANPTLTEHRPDANADVRTAGTSPLYALGPVELVVVEVDVRELRDDMRVLRELMVQLPDSQPRRHEIVRALERALDVLVLDDIAGTAGRARAELADVLARPAVPSAHRISAVGHAHIDTAWLWPLRETKRKCARTFANVLSLMDERPELIFVCSQAAQYEWMRDGYPSIFAGITRRVAEGRWIPVGGMWVEPDTNLTSGESLVRQLIHGQRFFRTHFGIESSEVWIPDVFGYSGSFPQVMRLAGIDRFLTQKLSWNDTNRFPHHTFLWEGIDGSTVFAHFPPVETYNATMAPGELAHAERTFADKGRATRSLMPFGFGDGGGGPTRQMLERFHRVRDLEGLPRVEIESPDVFFAAAMTEYEDPPRWVGELYFEAHRGTYTSQAKTKAGNRRCEHLLREAELWCLMAYGSTPHDGGSVAIDSVDGGSVDGYPADELDRIWKTVLVHQFHDILPGSSITWVHREAETVYRETIDRLDAIITAALAHLGRTRGIGTGVVANGAPADRDEIVILDAVDETSAAESLEPVRVDVRKPALDPHSFQRGREQESSGREPVSDEVRKPALDPHRFQRVAGGGVARRVTVPAFGLSGAAPADTEVGGDEWADVAVSARSLDNGLVRVELDERGLFASVYDLEHDREVLAPGARGNLLQLHPDFPNAFDAWDLEAFARRQVIDVDDKPSIETIDAGPLVGGIRITRSFRSSTAVQTVQLRAGSRRIDVRCEIDWHEREHVLKVAFPVDVHTDEVTREIQFGHVRSAIHTNTSWDAARFEVCAHRWIDVSETDYGIALLNDAKYGHDVTRTRHGDHRAARDLRSDGASEDGGTDVTGTTMRLTLLKASRYPDPEADQGRHVFTYSLLPHAGTARTAAVVEDIIAEGYRLNIPVRLVPPIPSDTHDETGPSTDETGPSTDETGPPPAPLVRCSNPGVIIEAVKPAEDGSGDIVVRLYEATGARATGILRFDGPIQVGHAWVTDLLERRIESTSSIPQPRLSVTANEVELELRPFQIVTLRIAAASSSALAGNVAGSASAAEAAGLDSRRGTRGSTAKR